MPWRKSLEALGNGPFRYLGIPGFSPTFGGAAPAWPGGHDSTRTVRTPEQMREELSKLEIDIGILFPDNLLLLALFPQREYAAALARAYNAWLVDKWCDRQPGLKGVIVACPRTHWTRPGRLKSTRARKASWGFTFRAPV